VQHGRHSTSCVYQLIAVTRDGTHKTLLRSLDQAEQALYLEQQIEEHLKIEDRSTGVRGEIT